MAMVKRMMIAWSIVALIGSIWGLVYLRRIRDRKILLAIKQAIRKTNADDENELL